MNIELIQLYLKNHAEIFGFLTFLLGLLFGNWLAIGRDKRIEFNEASAPVRTWFLKEYEDPTCGRKPLSISEIDVFTSYLSQFKRRSFLKHYEKLISAEQAAKTQDKDYGSESYLEVTSIKNAAKKCLSYTNRR